MNADAGDVLAPVASSGDATTASVQRTPDGWTYDRLYAGQRRVRVYVSDGDGRVP